MNDVLKAIYERRSIREYTDDPVPEEYILEILKAGSWAPSGLNNQPWRFAIVTDPGLKERFEPLTKYTRIIRSANCLLPVFISRERMYHDIKDFQAIGACLQNMLLCAHSLGLGAVWLGEILKSGEDIKKLLGLSEDLMLMAVVALGWPRRMDQKSRRLPLNELIVFKE